MGIFSLAGLVPLGGFVKGGISPGFFASPRRWRKTENAEARSQPSRKLVLTLAGIGVVG